jgi:hydrogenase/urease accessory protein HupE
MLKFFAIQLRKFLVFFLFALAGHSSYAHLITAGNLTLNILPDKAVLLVGVPVAFFKGIDTNQDGLLQPEEIKSQREQIIEQLDQAIEIKMGGLKGEVIDDQIIVSLHVDSQSSTPQIEWLRQLKFSEDNFNQPVKVEFSERLLVNEYFLKVQRSEVQEVAMLSSSHSSHAFFKDRWQAFLSFVIEGWNHIVHGYDHVVFVIILLAASVQMKRWLWVLTSFTLAHGITYALASFGLVQVKPELIEPIIAITILITAMLNLFKIQPQVRSEMAVVFGFGLFHGLGFASAMSIQLNGARFPVSTVLGFNLGVEMGQIAIAAVLGFVFWALKSQSELLEKIRIGMIWIGFFAGAFWLFERI